MSQPDLLERVRMALAEVGVDPFVVRGGDRGDDTITGDVRPDSEVSKMCWRATELACWSLKRSDPSCWVCTLAAAYIEDDAEFFAAHARCQAIRPCVEDCGVDRSPALPAVPDEVEP